MGMRVSVPTGLRLRTRARGAREGPASEGRRLFHFAAHQGRFSFDTGPASLETRRGTQVFSGSHENLRVGRELH